VKILSQGFKFTEAIKLADQFELDLVEIFQCRATKDHGLQEICLRTKET
jgi:rRNA processing protein Krr1/Pno1